MDEEELRKIFQNEPRFAGVFAANEISELKLEPERGFIVNTSDRRHSYGHWLVIYRGRFFMYFIDSLCIKNLMYDPNFITFFKNNQVKMVKTLSYSVQPVTSQTCGVFSVYFLSNLFKRIPFVSIISHFSNKNLFINDIIVNSYVMEMLK